MDPNSNNTSSGPSGSSMALTILLFVLMFKSATWMMGVLIDGEPLHEGSSSPPFEHLYRIIDTLQGPIGNALCIIGIVAAGMAYMTGNFGFGFGGSPTVTGEKPKRVPTLPMSEVARAAEARLNALSAQFRSIPENMVLPEASIEFEAIEARHVPDVQLAHREARSTVSSTSEKAEALDADYAAMLDKISDSVQRLVDGCEALGRERLAVQGHFIEARHPGAGF